MANVLVVDDHPDYCRPLARLFQLAGHSAVCLHAGEDALNYLRSAAARPGGGPDVVLLDIMMPGMDGLEVLRNLREDPATASIPVVMFSAIGDPLVEQHALKKGANDYLVKGRYDFNELTDRLSKYLSSRPQTPPN